MSLKYEPSSEPLLISVKQLFLNCQTPYKRDLDRPVWGVRGTHPQLISYNKIGVWSRGSDDVGSIQSTNAPKRSTFWNRAIAVIVGRVSS